MLERPQMFPLVIQRALNADQQVGCLYIGRSGQCLLKLLVKTGYCLTLRGTRVEFSLEFLELVCQRLYKCDLKFYRFEFIRGCLVGFKPL